MRISNKLKLAVFSILVCTGVTTFAQQDPMYTQYMYNLATVNPAENGIDDLSKYTSLTRFHFVGVDGAPITHSLSADVPLKKFSSGVGASYFYDQLGPERSHNAYADYSYHLKLNRKINMSMGLKAGFKVYSANLDQVATSNVQDDMFSRDIQGDVMPNLGLGIMVYGDNFFGGISAPKLINHLNEDTDVATGNEERHYFIVGGYNYKINPEFVLNSTAYIRMVDAVNPSFDLSARVTYREFLTGGLAFRSGHAISLMFEVEVYENLWVGYAYDISINKLRAGSHELLVAYRMPLAKISNGLSKLN